PYRAPHSFPTRRSSDLSALKNSANIGFFKGVLLSDPQNILQQQGNIQSGRILKFTTVDEIKKMSEIIISYIYEGISVEEKGMVRSEEHTSELQSRENLV